MHGSGQFRLLTERRFGPFFGVQFLGAFNDNVFKQVSLRILEETPVPVVPIALRGLWGSFFSRRGGAATPEALQARVTELRGEWR